MQSKESRAVDASNIEEKAEVAGRAAPVAVHLAFRVSPFHGFNNNSD